MRTVPNALVTSMTMKPLSTHQIRNTFLDFFKEKGHTIVPSDSLVPKDDPTVLFTTAGMQQFKQQFLGHLTGFTRAASSQKCLRTDDLDEVGRTPFHHTFFEMLGNFSFGDYFKEEAITWAWEFLTQRLSLPAEKLWVSVFQEDDEAVAIWEKKIGIPPDRIVRLGEKSNFWPSEARTKGPNGPCGPCSEIFFDSGPNNDCSNSNCNPDCSCGRFSEVWNLVFTQYNRCEDGTLEPLPSKNIDTGMGLERLAAVIQGKSSNFEIDIFAPLLAAIDRLPLPPSAALTQTERFILADHIRAVVFAISDGVIPSNKERGSVLKRLINDSANIIFEQGADKPLFYTLVPSVVKAMGEAYPEIRDQEKTVQEWILRTEEAFLKVRRLRIPELKKVLSPSLSSEERGRLYFEYHDTFGLPLTTIRHIAEEKGLDEAALEKDFVVYENLMRRQQEQSRQASRLADDVFVHQERWDVPRTRFLGYETLEASARILKIVTAQGEVAEIHEGEKAKLILDQTPFYAEAGGQVGDTGQIIASKTVFEVEDTQKHDDVIVHIGLLARGSLAVGQGVRSQVKEGRRWDIRRHHTATHLLQAALRRILGSHVQQQGSLVDENRLRFDFTHPQALSEKQIQAVEDQVNAWIMSDEPVTKTILPLEEARRSGALAFFAEKYGEEVRVVSIGNLSKEFCGGTHCTGTGQIGVFKLISEGAIAQGIRRLEAVCGRPALSLIRNQEQQLKSAAASLKAAPDNLTEGIQKMNAKIRELERELRRAQIQSLTARLEDMQRQGETIQDLTLYSLAVTDIPMETVKEFSDRLRGTLTGAWVALIISEGPGGTHLLTAVSPEAIQRGVTANTLIQTAGQTLGARGGGRPQLAQAGFKDKKAVPEIMETFRAVITDLVSMKP